eukprot:TRINITY_DN6565_c0_g3_i1.p1 TRINITY_DN6565_c0_g3~~TRINITY_DN6565_c0_g3_i1.p1  ORF type:complete len:316 (+),score=66.40 TRINITY_DN6565_c0_g3_i1:52-948(+)
MASHDDTQTEDNFDDRDKDSEDEDEEEDATSRKNKERRPRTERVANAQMSPFDVHFSQMRARHLFVDGRPLEEAIASIEAVPWVAPEGADDTAAEDKPVWLLKAPFPPIEVLESRCKLRDEATGRPLIQSETGDELWDIEDRWFSLDNRRLHCLQKVATTLWPAKVVIDVCKVPSGAVTKARQLKKFRTLDRGKSVFIGGRKEGETLVRWSWKEAVGLKEDSTAEPQGVALRRRQPRRVHPLDPRNAHLRRQGRQDEEDEEDDSFASRIQDMSYGGFLAIFAFYILLRYVLKEMGLIQ